MRRRELVSYNDIEIDTIINGSGTPLVLLPSSARDSEDFDEIAEMFAAEGFLVLRPQPRGMCGSTGPMERLTLHDFAKDVAVVIEQLAKAPAFVLGHAFGQWIGRSVAADHPGLVKGVILAAAAAKAPDPKLRAELEKCINPSLPRQVRLAALQTAFFAPGHDASGWLYPWHPLAAKTQRAVSSATPQEEWWGAGSAPVLDLIAALDPWRPEGTRRGIVDDLGAERVTVRVIEGASHALIPEQPAAVVRAVTEWARALA
jgi:hypothetical protein